MFYTYILYTEKFDRFYIGQTNNLDNRIERHNNGYVKSTKAYIPWKIVYSEAFQTRALATQREKQLKKLKSKIAIQKLVDASRS